MSEQHAVDPIACFLTACEVERREHRSTRREHKVVNGRLLSAEGGRFFYCFDAPLTLHCKDDSSVQVIVGGNFYHGTVYSRSSLAGDVASNQQARGGWQRITVAIQANLGAEISTARIEGLDHDLLQSLILRLRAIQGNVTQLEWNSTLAHKVINLSKHEAKGTNLVEAKKLPDDLTPDQVTALSRCLSQPVTYLWGPPGTGKTIALAALALKLFQENKRVLIVSHTNSAVDGLIENLCRRITEKGRTALPEGSILRVGTMVRESLIEKFGSQVHLESAMHRNQNKVASRLEQLKRELTEVRDSLFAVSRKITLFDSREQLLNELERVQRDSEDIDLGFVSAVRRLFKPEGTHENDSDGTIVATESVDSLELLRSSADNLLSELKDVNRAALGEQSLELSSRQLEITEAIAVLEKFLRDLRMSLLDRARIIATTATQAMLSANDLHTFDAVLIDEASMLPLPLCFLLSGLARERVIIAGDFRQLPAVAMSDIHMVRQWYSRDVFDCAGIVDLVDARREHPALVTLTTQFRSNETLCSLVNERFYGGILQTAMQPNSGKLLFKEPLAYLNRSPVVVVDTSVLKAWGEMRNGSKSNLLHALVVRKIALLLSAHGAAFGPDALGIISPYRQQASIIKDLLDECAMDEVVSTGTVHKFQGSERDTIILDLTDSDPHELGGFFTARSLRDTGARLLNVALSRAKKHLFVVANLDFLRTRLRGRYVMSGVLDDLARVGYLVPVEELIGEPIFDTPSKEVREGCGVLAFQAFDEELFMPGLVTDLVAARQDVVFSSPTLTERVAHIIGSILEDRIQAGLRVTLRVSNKRESSREHEAIVKDLRSIGVVVVRSGGATPPAVVVDSEVVWLGSIAPFDAIAPARGLMTRCVSAKAALHTLELLESGEEESESEPLLAAG